MKGDTMSDIYRIKPKEDANMKRLDKIGSLTLLFLSL